jgi:transposase
MKYPFIRQMSSDFPVRVLCEVLAVSPSGYYDWLDREPSATQQRRDALKHQIAGIHAAASGMPWASTSTWCLIPGRPRSVGFGPLSSTPPNARAKLASTAANTPAHVPEVNVLVPLVDSAGPLDEELEPKCRPKKVYADRAYDSERHRDELRDRGIDPHFARRRTPHGSGLGIFRWVVERTISWLHGFRKLRFITEKRDEMKTAFLNLALALICFRYLYPS